MKQVLSIIIDDFDFYLTVDISNCNMVSLFNFCKDTEIVTLCGELQPLVYWMFLGGSHMYSPLRCLARDICVYMKSSAVGRKRGNAARCTAARSTCIHTHTSLYFFFFSLLGL